MTVIKRIADHLLEAVARTILVLGAIGIGVVVLLWLVSQRVIIIWG